VQEVPGAQLARAVVRPVPAEDVQGEDARVWDARAATGLDGDAQALGAPLWVPVSELAALNAVLFSSARHPT
jgi:hypothetical protein